MKELTYFEIEAVSGGFGTGASIGAFVGATTGAYAAFCLTTLAFGFAKVEWAVLGVAVVGLGLGGIVGALVGPKFN